MIKSHERGWEIYYDGKVWRYSDNGKACNGRRPCKRCGKFPTVNGYDACLGEIPGAKFACCGHGELKPNVILETQEEATGCRVG
jgi:hypothetical protein